jgi:Amt family ammonium transporter
VAITIGWTVLASYVILRVISLLIGLRVDQQDEIEGLDLSQHGERGHHSN